ncbi:MAG: class I SAM-dependent methyltransferase [Candidatus Dojkabacteria bacterium]
MDLYTTHAKEFSNTRQSPWEGWKSVLRSTYNVKRNAYNVLDLGCGNGRFLKYLKDEGIKISRYVGLDNSKILLNIAKKENTEAEFFDLDLNTMDWAKKIKGEFDLIVSFGVMHHIESFQLRRNILECSSNLAKKDATLAIAYWQFMNDEKLKAKALKLTRENDYELPFGQNGAKRFCHFVNETEALKLESELSVKRVDAYYADGKSKELNYYVIYHPL